MNLNLTVRLQGKMNKHMFYYDSENHQYFLNDVRLSGITEVMHHGGLSDYSMVDDYYMHRGNIVHKILECELNNELDTKSIDPELQGYYDSFLQCYCNVVDWDNVIIIEEPIYHPTLKYATKSDCYVPTSKSVINWKTGSKRESDRIQIAAEMEIQTANDNLCVEGLLIYLDKKGGMPKINRVNLIQKRTLFAPFYNALTNYHKEIKNGAVTAGN